MNVAPFVIFLSTEMLETKSNKFCKELF